MTAPETALKSDFGPLTRSVASRYFTAVRFPEATETELRALHDKGFVVHVMRTTAWVNFLYLAWAMIRRGLPPIRAVVNLRPWFSKPWRKTAQRGDFEVRFTYARRHAGSGLVFLRSSALGRARGKTSREDPFPALVALARKSDRPVFLVPELFVWEKWSGRMKPAIMDYVFGSPDAPGFVHSLMAFWRNHHRALFQMGEPIDLGKFIAENPRDPDELIARKVRGALHQHLARETRAVFGPPFKPAARVIEETLRDRHLREAMQGVATSANRKLEAVENEARKNLNQIAARQHPSMIGVLSPILHAVFNRIYDGIDVDEAALHRAMRSASHAPLVLCPSHKSHVDYLVLGWVLYSRGYTVPLVAAGANLGFFPLGWILRRGGAFFLRRSFKGDALYTASFKAYVKKLVHDGSNQEFFPEGGRSRTGKLLPAKLGLLTWEVDAVLEGARNDLNFVPVSIDYEKVVESSSYREELAGGEKKAEDIKGLLKTPKVLASKYGRIHLGFDAPVSLAELMKTRGLSVKEEIPDEQKKGLVRALGHRIMYGISRVSTVTPHALVSMCILAHRGRGIAASELDARIQTLRRMIEEDGAPSSRSLVNAPSDPTVMGPIQEAIHTFSSDGMIRTERVRNEVIYQAEDSRRLEMSFYKNTMMNLLAPRALVACAMFGSLERNTYEQVRDRALDLSRLFKVEFIYRVGASFDTIFAETTDKLTRAGILRRDEGRLAIAPEPHARPALEFLADMLRDYLESYLLAGLALQEIALHGPMDKKAFVKAALEIGRGEFLSGRIQTPESLSRTTLENAVSYFIDQKIVLEQDRKLTFGAEAETRPARVQELRNLIRNLGGIR